MPVNKASITKKPVVAATHIISTLPVIGERLQIGKRVAVNDGHRLTKRVSSREATVDELLRD